MQRHLCGYRKIYTHKHNLNVPWIPTPHTTHMHHTYLTQVQLTCTMHSNVSVLIDASPVCAGMHRIGLELLMYMIFTCVCVCVDKVCMMTACELCLCVRCLSVCVRYACMVRELCSILCVGVCIHKDNYG